jgi:hypothetical protein
MASRQLVAVRARIDAGQVGPDVDVTAPVTSSASWGAKVLIGAVVTSAVAGAGLALWPSEGPTSTGPDAGHEPAAAVEPEAVPEEPLREQTAALPEPPAIVEPPEPRPVVEVDETRGADRIGVRSGPETTDEADSVHLVEAELALVRPAEDALASDRPKRALRLLGEHAKRFPSGVLMQEREVLRAMALCRLGRTQEAERTRERLLAAHPNTRYRRRLAEICAKEGHDGGQ